MAETNKATPKPEVEKLPEAPKSKIVIETLPEEAAPKQAPLPRGPVLTTEQKIVKFIESKSQGGPVRLNEFLKSLFPLVFNDPSTGWKTQASSKSIKTTLSNMQASGQIKIVENAHEKLGKFYHAGVDQKTYHHNLDTVIITVE